LGDIDISDFSVYYKITIGKYYILARDSVFYVNLPDNTILIGFRTVLFMNVCQVQFSMQLLIVLFTNECQTQFSMQLPDKVDLKTWNEISIVTGNKNRILKQ